MVSSEAGTVFAFAAYTCPFPDGDANWWLFRTLPQQLGAQTGASFSNRLILHDHGG